LLIFLAAFAINEFSEKTKVLDNLIAKIELRIWF